MKEVRNIYAFPVNKREVLIGRGLATVGKYQEVDTIGFLVRYDKENESPTDSFIRRHLVSTCTFTYIVVAPTLKDAITKLYNDEGFKIGCKHKALELVDTEENPVIEYPDCGSLSDSGNWYKCNRFEEKDTPEENKMNCFLDGTDFECLPEDCPKVLFNDLRKPEKIYGVYVLLTK